MASTPVDRYSYMDGAILTLPIHKAAKAGDCALILSCLSTLTINDLTPEGYTPLHLAAAGNKSDAVRVLLENGADHEIEAPYDTFGPFDDASAVAVCHDAVDALKELLDYGVPFPEKALLAGSSDGSVGCMKLLLERLLGPDRKVADDRYALLRKALSIAAQEWRPQIVELLLKDTSRFFDHVEQDSGLTFLEAALHLLCQTNERVRDMQYIQYCYNDEEIKIPWDESLRVLELLLDAGANVNCRDRRSLDTPLSLLCSVPWIFLPSPLVLCLLEQGADTNIPRFDGRPPLMGALGMASSESDTPVIKALLDAGADHLAIDNYGDSALHCVSSRAATEILLEKGLDASAQNEEGVTPLHNASRRGLISVVEYLLSHGQDVEINGKTRTGWTPLIYAPGSDSSVELIKILLRHGADVHATSSEGWTVLHEAARGYNTDTIKLLLENGADIHARANSETPLHRASVGYVEEAIDLLVQHGADIEARDSSGSTPFLRALTKDGYIQLDILNSLLRHGADRNVTTTEGHTCDSIASAKSLEFTPEGLLQHKPPPPFRGNGRGRRMGGRRTTRGIWRGSSRG